MKKIILAFLILSCYRGISQELIVHTGWSISNHSDLRRQQELYNFLQDNFHTGVPLKAVQNYPSYFQHSLVARFPLGNRFKLGGTIFSTSSAARSIYEDYSGVQHMDYSLRCLGFGVTGSFSLFKPTPSLSVNLYAILGWNITTLKTHEYISLKSYGTILNRTEQYGAASPSTEIGIECQYFFTDKFFVRGSVGLHINSDATLTNDSQDYATVNWTGVKALAGIGYRF